MSTAAFDMWIGEKKISLHDVLKNLNFFVELHWVLHEFCGVREPFNGLTMKDLEKNLRSESQGYVLSSNEIEEFSKQIEDLNDLTLAGFHGKKKAVAIEGFDSTTWRVVTDDALVDSSQLEVFINGLR